MREYGWAGRMLVLVGWLSLAAVVRAETADELDAMFAVEELSGLTAPGMLGTGAEAETPEAEPAVTPAPAPPVAPPVAQSEASALQEENARLRRLLGEQEARHARELQRLHYNLGCVYRVAKQYTLAEAEFIKALALNPDDPAVHFNLGILYDDNLSRNDKARFHYERFLELAPADRDTQQVRGWLTALIP